MVAVFLRLSDLTQSSVTHDDLLESGVGGPACPVSRRKDCWPLVVMSGFPLRLRSRTLTLQSEVNSVRARAAADHKYHRRADPGPELHVISGETPGHVQRGRYSRRHHAALTLDW